MSIYAGRASVVIDLNFEVKADSLEDAKEKILGAYGMDFDLKNEKSENIFEDYEVNDWYVVENAETGNVQLNGIRDFEIHEEA